MFPRSTTEIQALVSCLPVRPFGAVDEPTMASADFCRSFSSSLNDNSPYKGTDRQISPGIALLPSRLCPPHLLPCFPYRYRTLSLYALSSSMAASYAVSVRQANALPAASFRFHLAADTLAVRLTLPPAGPVGDFHPQVVVPC